MKTIITLFIVILGFVLVAAEPTQFEQDCAKLSENRESDTARFQKLLFLEWTHTMQDDPEFATDVGYPGLNGLWRDTSIAAIERRTREMTNTLRAAESIDRSKLSPADQLSFDLFIKNYKDGIAGSRFKGEYLPITQLNGLQQDAARLLEMSPHATVKDYEDLISRLNGIPILVDQNIELLKLGLAAGITPPKITLRDVPKQIENQMVSDPAKSPFLRSFYDFPADIPVDRQKELRDAAITALQTKVIPAFDKLHKFFVDKYLPGARESIAAKDLPDGEAWYAHNIRTRTTTDLTAKQIHEIGLAEVARIRKAMDATIAQTGFKGSFADFCKYLRTDPQFFYTNADALLTGYRDIAKRIDPELPHLFGKLPRLTYGVKAVPAYAEDSQTTAYYEPGSPAAGRPGWYFANTGKLNTRPKWEMEALTLHESVPGHHLQIALAQEMPDAPDFRKHGSYTAFVEGWGLYAESLGGELGMYRDPYMKFGQLTYEMWRAVRLVVDTGMHSMGWSRQQAIDFFLANTSKSEHDVTVEIDRYIVWPGQALAYKIGELKFKELRAYATRELGPKFDIRSFHDQLLDQGALPLDLVEKRIKTWVQAQKQETR